MSCDECREALSARMDDEWDDADATSVDEHLAHCQACCAWERDATRLNRLIRVRPAVRTPDLTDRVVAAVSAAAADRRSGPGRTWRYLLGTVGVVQLVLGASELLGLSNMGMTMSTNGGQHLFNESSAWNIALAIGFVIAAVRPRIAGGLVPTLGAFIAVLSVVSVRDILDGNADLTRVTSHVILVVGLAFLVVVHRRHAREPGPGQRLPGTTRPFFGEEPMPDRRSPRARAQRGRMRPAGRQSA